MVRLSAFACSLSEKVSILGLLVAPNANSKLLQCGANLTRNGMLGGGSIACISQGKKVQIENLLPSCSLLFGSKRACRFSIDLKSRLYACLGQHQGRNSLREKYQTKSAHRNCTASEGRDENAACTWQRCPHCRAKQILACQTMAESRALAWTCQGQKDSFACLPARPGNAKHPDS